MENQTMKVDCGSCRNAMFMRHDTWMCDGVQTGVPGIILKCKAFGVALNKIGTNYVLSDVNGLISECNQYSGSGKGVASKKRGGGAQKDTTSG